MLDLTLGNVFIKQSPGFDQDPIVGSGSEDDGLIPDWFEIHPLFKGNEFDVAIIGLRTAIPRKILTVYFHSNFENKLFKFLKITIMYRKRHKII